MEMNSLDGQKLNLHDWSWLNTTLNTLLEPE